MGRMVVTVKIKNALDPPKTLDCRALVDTGAAYMTLPMAWKDRLGDFKQTESVELISANQTLLQGIVCGPVQIQVEGFRPIFNEVVFVDMESQDNQYEPLVGYLVLEQAQIAVDRVGHRLLHVKHLDCKRFGQAGE